MKKEGVVRLIGWVIKKKVYFTHSLLSFWMPFLLVTCFFYFSTIWPIKHTMFLQKVAEIG